MIPTFNKVESKNKEVGTIWIDIPIWHIPSELLSYEEVIVGHKVTKLYFGFSFELNIWLQIRKLY